MTQRGSQERTEELISLARNNPQLATHLLSQLPAEQRATLVAALARPPRKAVPRDTSAKANGPGVASVGKTAYSAQLNAFAKSVSRVS